MDDDLRERIAACDTHFYESSTDVGLAYYAGDTIEERMKSLVDEYRVATAGARSVAVTPIVFTALLMHGVDVSNCVVDPYQSDTTKKRSAVELNAIVDEYRRSRGIDKSGSV